MTEVNNLDKKNLNDSNSSENVLQIIKDQNKELKLLSKKLTKLEEKYIKMNSDYKMLQNDKTNIESFLKIIFPKEMYEKLIKTELGLYDTAELNRFWVVVEGAKQNDYQKFINQVKSENIEITKKYESIKVDMESKLIELDKLKVNSRELNNTAICMTSMYNDIALKYDSIDKERSVILSMLEDKERQIEKLSSLEIENAELKAKTLLDNFETKKDDSKVNKKKNIFNINTIQEKHLNITSINTGTQTSGKVFNQEFVDNLNAEISELNKKLDQFKKEFQDHREKSNKIIISTEENYKKLLIENENLKTSHELLSKTNNELTAQNNNLNLNLGITNDSRLLANIKNKEFHDGSNIRNTLNNQNISVLNPNMSIIEIEKQRVSVEYLKNVLLKYLEAIAIGNESQIKILENVIFAILNIPNDERIKLEEKRTRSSFYYNLWYNAKAFLSARIYGNYNNPINSNDTSSFIKNGNIVNHLNCNTPKNYNLSSLNEFHDEKVNKLSIEEKDLIDKKEVNDIY